jgi:hypothetical protein
MSKTCLGEMKEKFQKDSKNKVLVAATVSPVAARAAKVGVFGA